MLGVRLASPRQGSPSILLILKHGIGIVLMDEAHSVTWPMTTGGHKFKLKERRERGKKAMIVSEILKKMSARINVYVRTPTANRPSKVEAEVSSRDWYLMTAGSGPSGPNLVPRY